MSIFSSIGSTIGGAVGGPFGAVTGGLGGNLGGPLGTLTNILGGGQARGDTRGLVNQGITAGDPFNEGARQPFISALTGLLNPSGESTANFLTNDPSVQAQKGMIGDWMKANFAKSGNLPLTGIEGSSQLANVFSGQLNQRIQNLLTAGGFQLPNYAVGQVVGSALGPMMQSNQQTQNMFGGLLGMGMGGIQNLFSGGGGGGAASIAPELMAG